VSADPGLAIEEASLRAWPAITSEMLDGWELRFGEGFTRRANSVQPLGTSSEAFAKKVAHCEAWYAARSLPCTFRLTRFADPDLDSFLSGRGYQAIDRVAIMDRPIPPVPVPRIRASIEAPAAAEWTKVYGALMRLPDGPPPAMTRILEACRKEQRFAVLPAAFGGAPASCGLAVHDGPFVGLFDLVTAPALRRRGYCTTLISGLLEWGVSRGATRAYLQVVSANTPAIALYTKLGFETRYEYWYRVKPA
jgi:N-acetylglutamate synthase